MDAPTVPRTIGELIVKLQFFKRPAEEQALIFRETAARRGLLPVMVEKDFWVSWTLAALFGNAELGRHLVFKGGTSLSKVFGVIDRFSEDIDLSVSPRFLGISEESVEQAESRSKRTERMEHLEAVCTERVREYFLPKLQRIANEALSNQPGAGSWMEFQVDEMTHSPIVLFHYPTSEKTGFEYLRRFVKMEFGSLTDQQPVGTHAVRPWSAEVFPKQFEDFTCDVVALELERSFWEKATILHAEYYRDRAKPIRDRFSRHYSDMAALARSSIVAKALTRADIRQRVADWKSRFFPATWARYDLAKPGTFRLVPAHFRLTELNRDYEAMRDMFTTEPPSFESVMKTVLNLEDKINGR